MVAQRSEPVALSIERLEPKPFVKWVGGKRGLLPEILPRLPTSFGRYYEPFVGGGALFFAFARRAQKSATLVDRNAELVATYRAVHEEPIELIEALRRHAEAHTREHYYLVRSQNPGGSVEGAARFIYLNRTCFNGLYRVNRAGRFNVPFGRYENPDIMQVENIWACHRALGAATIVCADFSVVAPAAGDLVYFDPPYHKTTRTAFTGYTDSGFSDGDHERLRDFAKRLAHQGAYVVLSNARTPFIDDLYSIAPFRREIVRARRAVACRADRRGSVEELLILGY